jgi:hypothetical protein
MLHELGEWSLNAYQVLVYFACPIMRSLWSLPVSLAMQCPVDQVMALYGNNVGYNIGGNIYSLAKLKIIGEYDD